MTYYYLINIESIKSKIPINNKKFLFNEILNPKFTQGIDYIYVTSEDWHKYKKQGFDIEIPREIDPLTNTIDEHPSVVTFNLHIDNMIIKKKQICNRNKRVCDIIKILFSVENYIVRINNKDIDPTDDFGKYEEVLCLDIHCMQVCGLSNLGNTCFMNSALQCLYNLDNFRHYLLNHRFEGNLTNATRDLFAKMGLYKFFCPSEFRNVFGKVNGQFMDYEQHDAEEFLRALLNCLDDELKKEKTILEISLKSNMSLSAEERSNTCSGQQSYNEENLKDDRQNSNNETHKRDEARDKGDVTKPIQIGDLNDDKNEARDDVRSDSGYDSDHSCRSNKININQNKRSVRRKKKCRSHEEDVKFRLKGEERGKTCIDGETNSEKINTSKETLNANLSETVTSEGSVSYNTEGLIQETQPHSIIKSEKNEENIVTAIDEMFRGKVSSTQTCLDCDTSNTIEEPFLFLSLPIPTEKVIHRNAFLIRNGVIQRLQIPRNINVKDLKYKLKDINVQNVMVVTTNGERRKILHDEKCINTYNNIFCYEYNPDAYYFWLVLKKKNKFSFFDTYFFYHMLLEIECLETTLEKVKKNLKFFGDEDGIENFDSTEAKGVIDSMLKTYQVEKERKLLSSNNSENPKTNCQNVYELRPDVSFYNSILEQIVTTYKHDALFKPQTKQLEISLNDCLNLYFTKEYLVNDDKYYCSICKKVTEHSKALNLCAMPKYLTIHLSRFSFTKKKIDKVNNYVDFPLTIEKEILSPYFKSDCKIKDYELVSVSNHLNLSYSCGHYTAYVYRNNKWYCCNDSVVSEIREINKDNAYILFYKAID